MNGHDDFDLGPLEDGSVFHGVRVEAEMVCQALQDRAVVAYAFKKITCNNSCVKIARDGRKTLDNLDTSLKGEVCD